MRKERSHRIDVENSQTEPKKAADAPIFISGTENISPLSTYTSLGSDSSAERRSETLMDK